MTDLPMTKAPDDLVEIDMLIALARKYENGETDYPPLVTAKTLIALRSQLAAAEANGDRLFKLGVHHQER